MKEIRLLTAEDIDVKVKQVTEKGAVLLLYKNARVDMRILDDTFGSMNWQDDYREIKGNLYCGIGIRESADKEFVWKWDCGIESREDEGNEKKGEASDSFKRAGFKWGIGRELYTAPFVFASVPVKEIPQRDGKSIYKLANSFEKFKVKEIDYVARVITKLVIVDSKNNVVYNMNSKTTPKTAPQTTNTTKDKPQTSNNPQTSAEAPKNNLKCSQCNEPVIQVVADYSQNKYGKILCRACQKKQ